MGMGNAEVPGPSQEGSVPENSDSGRPKTPDKGGGGLDAEGVDKIVGAIGELREDVKGSAKEAAKTVADETKTQAEKTRDHLTKLNKELIDKLEQIRSLQEQLKNAPNPTLISDAMDKIFKDELGPLIRDLSVAMDGVHAVSQAEITQLQELTAATQGLQNLSKEQIAQLQIREDVLRAYL